MSVEPTAIIFTDNEIKAAAKAIASIAKKNPVYVAECLALDKSGERNVSLEILYQLLHQVVALAPHTHIMIVAGGSTDCTVAAHIDHPSLTANDWISRAIDPFSPSQIVETIDSRGSSSAAAQFAVEFAFKHKDIVRSNAFSVYRSAVGHDADSSDSEENIVNTFNINDF